MKKLLIIGSDFGTISVVKEAHKQGFYVIVADLMESSPTKEEADEAWLISTTEIGKLEKKSRKAGVSAIMFGASDFNISNCRELCKRLNLPIYCENDSTWNIVRNKREFKDLCQKVGAPVAKDYFVTDDTYIEIAPTISYPVVVKPSDKSGNRGMSFCANKDDFINAYQLARSISENSIIVERQLNGEEFNVHYAIADGEARLLYFSSTHHQPGFPSNLYSFKCITSNHLRQYVNEVNEKVVQVIKRAGCKEGIAWVDVIRDVDGNFYLLEMGYRFGGVMTYVPYEEVSGFNTVKWMLDIALGIKHQKNDLPKFMPCAHTACAVSYNLFARHSGTIGEIKGLCEISKIDRVYIDIPKRVGSTVRGRAGMGLIGIYGKDVEDLCEKVARINELLEVNDDNGNNLIIKFDDYQRIKQEYFNGLLDFQKSK